MIREPILRTLVIGTDETLSAQMVQTLIHSSHHVTAQLALPRNENRGTEELLRLERPSLVFLEADDFSWCINTAMEVHHRARTIPIIAFSRYIDTPSALELMRAGVREWLEAPVDEGTLRATIEKIRSELHELGSEGRPPSELVSFFPCKPGSGSSTVAAHAASLCAKATGSPVALFDLDLACGTLQFITEAEGGKSLHEAAQHAHRLDESLWTRFVAKRGGIHLLHAAQPSLDPPLDPHQLHLLLSYAANQYPVVIADLSGTHERFAIHALEQSSQIYMVCSPDLTSLYLARRQLHFLRELGFLDRVELIVNRATYHVGLGKAAVEEILERKPVAYFPNAYIPLQKALREHSLISEESPFAQSVSGLVRRITNLQTPAPVESHETGGWMARTKFTHTIQALKAAIHSLRPPGHEPSTADKGVQAGTQSAGQPGEREAERVGGESGAGDAGPSPAEALHAAAGPQAAAGGPTARRRRRGRNAEGQKTGKQLAD